MRSAELADLVIPTAGRPSLGRLLEALAGYGGRVLLVDDRPARVERSDPRPLGERGSERPARLEVLRAGGRGPAAARNLGWRAARSAWVAFLDDDVVPPEGWAEALRADLADLPWRVAACQGAVRVPLPAGRRPTDWERNVAGLEAARWATADMALRRSALAAVGGFDERFPRAYREDADLGLRLEARGLALARGERWVSHPVGPAPRSVSVAKQRGNADDALMGALHGRRWRERAGAPRGRLARHAALTGLGALALAAAASSAPRPGRPGRSTRHPRGVRVAQGAAAGWLAGTAELAWARIAPGPRTRAEVVTMLWTSAVLPAAATAHRLRGELGVRRPLTGRARVAGGPVPARPLAVLLDRDDTLVHDVPYNGDPELVLPITGAGRALGRLRAAGLPLAIVSNQSGIARGLLTPAQVQAVTDRVVERLGPFDDVRWCPHGAGDGCACRKPAPGLLLAAAAALGVDPLRCAMVGDIGADVEAARAAGMRGILVPTARTRREEVAAAAEVVPTLGVAVDLLLAGEPVPGEPGTAAHAGASALRAPGSAPLAEAVA